MKKSLIIPDATGDMTIIFDTDIDDDAMQQAQAAFAKAKQDGAVIFDKPFNSTEPGMRVEKFENLGETNVVVNKIVSG